MTPPTPPPPKFEAHCTFINSGFIDLEKKAYFFICFLGNGINARFFKKKEKNE